jgi:MFS transporter, FSR family, fosmidomycin resistance protein
MTAICLLNLTCMRSFSMMRCFNKVCQNNVPITKILIRNIMAVFVETMENKTNIKVIFALTLVHFTGDFYSAFSIPLMPVFVSKLSLNMTQVGLMMGMIRLLAFVVQPTVGYLADRFQTRFFVLGGLGLSVFFIPLTGIATTYWLLVMCFALGSFGSSMFHPSVTGMVPLYGGRNVGFSMSVFNTGGTLAFGIGPVFITWYVARFGLSAMPFTMMIGLVALGYLFHAVPVPISEGFRYHGFWGSLKEMFGDVWKPLVLIWLVMVLRAAVGQSFMTFMPIHLSGKGFSLVSLGLVTSIFIVSGTVSGLLSGYFSDRFEIKKIFLVAHVFMVPALLIFLHAEGHWVYVCSAMAGFFVLATIPVSIVMAQQLAPKGRSMVASLMMGFAYGLGGAMTPITGKLADLFAIQSVLQFLCYVPLITVGLIFFFPTLRGMRQQTDRYQSSGDQGRLQQGGRI